MQASTGNSDFFPRVVFTRKIKVDLPPPLKGRDLETTQPKTEPTKSDGAAYVAAFFGGAGGSLTRRGGGKARLSSGSCRAPP